MKIAVIGGTGLIGSQLVKVLNVGGYEAVPHSPSSGVDLLSGQGLPEALKGADVVVNLTNSPTFDDASPSFFKTSMDNLLAAAKAADVGHAVILSIVGADQVPGLAYYRAKVLQEDILRAGPVPYSIVRATQFFEFIPAALSFTADERTVRLPATLVQPIASVAAGSQRPQRPPRDPLRPAARDSLPIRHRSSPVSSSRRRPPRSMMCRTPGEQQCEERGKATAPSRVTASAPALPGLVTRQKGLAAAVGLVLFFPGAIRVHLREDGPPLRDSGLSPELLSLSGCTFESFMGK
jgi:hypothetical protein